MKKLYHTSSALSTEIAEKRRLMYERHGGLMTPTDLCRELGYVRPERGDQWAEEHDIPAIRLAPRKRRYETDLVAKALVQSRYMV